MKNKEVILSLNVAPVDDSILNVGADTEDDVDNARYEYYQVRRWDNVDIIVQNYEDDEENNSFSIEVECCIGSIPGQPDNLFTFPNGKDVLDDPLFHSNHNSVDNGADVGNNVVPDTIYGAIYDRNNAENPPPLLPESVDDNVWNLERD